jgi:hypothetical protein
MKKIYIEPAIYVVWADMEEMFAGTPLGTDGLENGNGNDGDFGRGDDDGGEGGDVWGDVKGYTVWDNMW